MTSTEEQFQSTKRNDNWDDLKDVNPKTGTTIVNSDCKLKLGQLNFSSGCTGNSQREGRG